MRKVRRTGYAFGTLVALSIGVILQAAPSTIADAAMQGDRAAVQAMLKSGADVNMAQGDGMTALHWAALKNDADLAKALLRAGARVNATTRLGGYTPLLLAAKDGHVAVIEALVAAGADANEATTNGTTPLMLAAAAGKSEGVKTLLDHGAKIDAKEVKGETAIMFAAAFGRPDTIKVLAARGADVNATMNAVDLTVTQQATQAPAGATTGKNISESESSEPRRRTSKGQAINPYNLLVAAQGGLTPLLFAAREGYIDAVQMLIEAG